LSSSSARLEVKARTSGTLAASVDIVMIGPPDGSGGLSLQQSQASFGPLGAPTQYTGQIVGLDGPRIVLSLADRAGRSLELRVDLSTSGSQVSGELMSINGADSEGNPQ